MNVFLCRGEAAGMFYFNKCLTCLACNSSNSLAYDRDLPGDKEELDVYLN
jgi:hypothetical protein